MNSTQFKNAVLLALVIILSIVAVISNLPSILKRSTGSFEYIRKGEDLLDGGKYSQAIKYFEKAYEASPDNETISSDLVYA
jgi:tetratricopeptide (TPR) repeat protein